MLKAFCFSTVLKTQGSSSLWSGIHYRETGKEEISLKWDHFVPGSLCQPWKEWDVFANTDLLFSSLFQQQWIIIILTHTHVNKNRFGILLVLRFFFILHFVKLKCWHFSCHLAKHLGASLAFKARKQYCIFSVFTYVFRNKQVIQYFTLNWIYPA